MTHDDTDSQFLRQLAANADLHNRTPDSDDCRRMAEIADRLDNDYGTRLLEQAVDDGVKAVYLERKDGQWRAVAEWRNGHVTTIYRPAASDALRLALNDGVEPPAAVADLFA